MRLTSALGLTCGLALATTVSAQTTPPATPAKPPAQPALPGQVQPGQVQPKQVQPAQTNLYPPTLYRMNDVGKALNLTQDQVTNLNKLTDQTQARYRDDFAKLGTLSDAERFARQQELNRLYATDWNKAARDVFNDTQRTRYQQLQYQYGGFGTLYDPDVQKQLNLTPAQVKDLRGHWDWSTQQMQDVTRLGTTDAAKGTQAYQGYWTQRQERLDRFLTPEQQKAWRGLVGDPFTFQPTFTPPK